MYYVTEPMCEADIPGVQAIERLSLHTAWSAETYRRELRNEANCYLIARATTAPPLPTAPPPLSPLQRLLARWLPSPERARQTAAPGPVIGYAGLLIQFEEGHIIAIAVDAAQRGKGIGELLLNGLIDHAMTHGGHMLTLEVRASNHAAQQLYRKYGFEAAGKRPRYYTDNGEDAVIMWTGVITEERYTQRLGLLRQALFARLRTAADKTDPVPRVASVQPKESSSNVQASS